MYLMELVYGAAVWAIIIFIVSILTYLFNRTGTIILEQAWKNIFVCVLIVQVIWAYYIL